MFRRRKEKYHRRVSNPILIFFRLILSLGILAILVGGVYSAYKQFSGMDPLKISPKALVASFVSTDKLVDLGINLLNFDPKKVTGSAKTDQAVADSSHGVLSEETNSSPTPKPPALRFKFALVADSENDQLDLQKALSQIKDSKVEFVIGLGDYTDVGTVSEFQDTKKLFDGSGLRYFLTPGDHDLWDSRDKGHDPLSNFSQVFGADYQSFSFENSQLIILDDSDNYKGVGDSQMNFLKQQLTKAKADSAINSILVFMHEPLYHPSSDHMMGRVTPELATQAKNILGLLKDAGAKGVFAGDVHYFTSYVEPSSGIPMNTIGALVAERNAQNPRFAIVSVFSDGSFKVEDVEVR